MDVLISVDMEGVAGIANRHQTTPGGRDYAIARELMTAEANAAVAGAFDGGAGSVVINDSHGPMDNLLGEKLDPRADYVVGRPKPLGMMQEVTPGTGVALFVGYHGGASDPAGVLAHTYSSVAFTDVRLNGHSVTEAELNALAAAADGVPVGLVTGDNTICAVAEKALPGVITVQVKTAIGHTAARTRHPQAAREAIRAGAARAVAEARAGRLRPAPIPDELVVEADFRPTGAAELAVCVPGSERTGSRSVRRLMANPREMVDVLTVWFSLAGQLGGQPGGQR
jgi:D-amino peptidase